MALIDEGERRHMAELRRDIAFLELATDAGFHDVFTRELAFDGRGSGQVDAAADGA